jgi:tRNA-specific 2-thiouridylase
MSDRIEVEHVHWLAPRELLESAFECGVKTRYRQSDLACSVRLERDSRAFVSLHAPARAVTPGQYAVFYQNEVCLGGGVIAERRNSRSGQPPLGPVFTYNSHFSLEGS